MYIVFLEILVYCWRPLLKGTPPECHQDLYFVKNGIMVLSGGLQSLMMCLVLMFTDITDRRSDGQTKLSEAVSFVHSTRRTVKCFALACYNF